MINDLDALELEDKLEAVEQILSAASTGHRDVIDQLTGHLANAGGKRLRPVLASICAYLGPNPNEPNIVKAAAVVELTHLASLYHDDVMDSAPTRRGAPSAQHLWGNNRAILAGDVLFAEASKLGADLGPESVRRHATSFVRMCTGQLNESFGPDEGDSPVEFYIQVLADKTGALVAEAAAMGALHSGASPELIEIVEAFGEKIGVAFQIADDVIDLDSSADVTGKTPGTDLREGVDTLPILLLKQQADEGLIDSAGTEILNALAAKDLNDDGELEAVVDAIRSHPVLDETRRLAAKWADDAVTELDGLPDGRAKEGLLVFARLMVDRQA